MKQKWLRRALQIFVGLCLFFLLFVLTVALLMPILEKMDNPRPPDNHNHGEHNVTTGDHNQSSTPAVQTPVRLNLELMQNAQDHTVFVATPNNLIVSFNTHYTNDMFPLGNWREYPDVTSPCVGIAGTRFEYQADPTIHSYPAVSVFTTGKTQQICEISLSLSQHDWSTSLETIYREQAVQILALFLPKLSQTQLNQLYNSLMEDAHKNQYIDRDSVPVPKMIRVGGTVGCWSYVHGGMIRINIIPIDAQYIADYTAGGGKTYRIHL